MKTLLNSTMVVLVCLALSFTMEDSCAAQDRTVQDDSKTEKKETTLPFMQAKLVGSQNVLEGLVTEDFDRIFRGAQNMKRMSEAAQWPRSADKVYDHYGEQFRNQCDKLMKLADEKNLEGAHYTYLGMTTTCINCHSYVRGRFRVQHDKDNPKGPVQLIPTEWEGNTYRSNEPKTQ